MNEITLKDLQDCRDIIFDNLFSATSVLNPTYEKKWACYTAIDDLVKKHLGLKGGVDERPNT